MIKKIIIKKRSKRLIKKLQQETGLFIAANCKKTGYNKAWIRDNIYEALGLEAVEDINSVKVTYSALFDMLLKHEYKIDWAIKEKPDYAFKYIHARYNPITFDEYHEEWGNKQNDAIGAFLFKVGDLYTKGVDIIRDENDLRILKKLVMYLEKIEYWHDPDNGIWENEEEIHASSVGACAAGLEKIKNVIHVDDSLIARGKEMLNKMLPAESESRKTDLALLSLIYPYNIVDEEQKDMILKNVEKYLVREKGVIRYYNDWYYAAKDGREAQWVMGFAWLAKIYKEIGNKVKYDYYVNKLHSCANWKGELPELYYYNDEKLVYNENTPLGWSQAMYLVAIS